MSRLAIATLICLSCASGRSQVPQTTLPPAPVERQSVAGHTTEAGAAHHGDLPAAPEPAEAHAEHAAHHHPADSRSGAPIRRLLAGGDAERGAALFAKNCSRCHGKSGVGNGPMADTLPRQPRNLTDASAIARLTPEHLYQVVRDGGTSVSMSKAMPAFGDKLNDDEIADVLAYVHGLSR